MKLLAFIIILHVTACKSIFLHRKQIGRPYKTSERQAARNRMEFAYKYNLIRNPHRPKQ